MIQENYPYLEMNEMRLDKVKYFALAHIPSKCWTCFQIQVEPTSVSLCIRIFVPKENYVFRLVGSREVACKGMKISPGGRL